MNRDHLERTGRRLVVAMLLLTVAAPFAVQADDSATPEVVVATAISVRPAQPLPTPPPVLVAAAALVMDVNTGRIFYEKNADQRREVASTQKLMTALLVCEAGDLDGLLTVDVADTRVVPSKLYLKAGEQHPRGVMLRSLMIKSANDVACCLARDNAGSVEGFIEKMNERAQQLGMVDSHFLSPSGLSEEGQYSTARDMARLARQAYRHPVIRDAVSTKTFSFKHNSGKVKDLGNTNRLLWTSPYCNGLKTGFTNAAGKCLISSGQKDGAEVIAVVLGSTAKLIWKDSQSLLHWALGVDESKEKPLAAPEEEDIPEEE
ncbi:MAG: D-alanyl-D-alanine carboxypeptidase [Verrucomicrobia bacterium]|nr:D-alanyl-D-alanine carboxypeptidase [Verrucomicrobiota bacterium]